VEGFLTAAQGGDEAGVKGAVVTAKEHEEAAGAYLDLMVATAQLQKAAMDKFGATAGATFGTASGPALETRLKAVRAAGVKMAGESAIVTLPADEANKQAEATFILKKSGGAGGGWKIDGASLFNLATEAKEKTAKNVALSKKLLVVTKGMIAEINEGKYGAAADAFQEFWTRSSKAAKEIGEGSVEPAGTQGAGTQKG
jgi:hypothetical protein